MELAPYLAVASGQVVKASKGHFPQPFLISSVIKNWRKDIGERFLRTKKFLNRDLWDGWDGWDRWDRQAQNNRALPDSLFLYEAVLHHPNHPIHLKHPSSDIKPEVHHIAILHHVFFSFNAQTASVAGS